MPGEFMGIGENGFDQLLSRRLVGPGGAMAPAAAPELFPTLVLESERPEWDYLYGKRRGLSIADVAAVAAAQSTIRLRNPVGGNTLVVLERADIFVGGATTVRLVRSIDVVDLATAQGSSQADFRVVQDGLSPAASTQLVVSGEALVAGGITNPRTIYQLTQLPTGPTFTLQLPIIIPPGAVLNFQAATVNLRLAIGLAWTERFLNPTER